MNIKAIALALTLVAPAAQAQDFWGQMVPIIVGGAAGYKIADHYGGHDGELAAGAVLGSVIANRAVAYRRGVGYGYPVSYGCASGYSSGCYGSGGYGYGYTVPSNPFYSQCSRMVPPTYANNSGAAQAWIEGCQNRMTQQQAEFEQRAYEEGSR